MRAHTYPVVGTLPGLLPRQGAHHRVWVRAGRAERAALAPVAGSGPLLAQTPAESSLAAFPSAALTRPRVRAALLPARPNTRWWAPC